MIFNKINFKNILTLTLTNIFIFFVTLNVFEVAQVIIVEGNTSFSYNNLWWFNYFFGIFLLFLIPQSWKIIRYSLSFNKILFIKIFIKKLKLTTQYISAILFSIIIINIITFTKIVHILGFDVLNFLNYYAFFLNNFELNLYFKVINFEVFSYTKDSLDELWLPFYTGILVDELFLELKNNININAGFLSLSRHFWLISYFNKNDLVYLGELVTKSHNSDFVVDTYTNLWKESKIFSERAFSEKYVYSFFFEVDWWSLTFFKDGLTFWLLWLVSLVLFVISFGTDKKTSEKNIIFNNFYIYNHLLMLILILMVVCFSIKDLFIFFISFEMILIPLFLHIIFQGSRLNKIQAVKYLVIYTLVGSIFLWYAITYFIEILGTVDFDQIRWMVLHSTTSGTRKVLFLCLFLGFAFKVPLVPFHHWLIIAHVEAPTNGSIILAALLLKVGGYGLYRFVYNIFPMEVLFFSNEILAVALFGYTFATLMAIRQVDLKRYVAYTSIAHMNFSLLGLFSTYDVGILGYVHMMISHGIVSSAMFFLVGYIYNILHFRDSIRLSGMAYSFPKFSIFLFLFSIANMGLPLFSGFPGEFFIMIAVMANNEYFGLFIFFGFMFSGVYNFLQINKVLFSTNTNLIFSKKKDDLDPLALVILSVLLYWSVVLGLFPDIITQNVEIHV